MTHIRIGAKLPSSGRAARRTSLTAASISAEDAGFDSIWVSDHVVMIRDIQSRYPFTAEGHAPWDPELPWFDALVAMSAAAAVTDRVEVGVAVLVVPLRNPIVLAKQLASIDALSGGRVAVGAGAGWLAEEFDALHAPFHERGARLDEWIKLMRQCWTGSPPPGSSPYYSLADGVVCQPVPAGDLPLLIGGMSPAALRRAGRIGDGWLAQQDAGAIDPGALGAGRAAIAAAAAAAGRAAPQRTILRLTGSVDPIAGRLDDLAAAGVTDVIVDVDWGDDDGPSRALEALGSPTS